MTLRLTCRVGSDLGPCGRGKPRQQNQKSQSTTKQKRFRDSVSWRLVLTIHDSPLRIRERAITMPKSQVPGSATANGHVAASWFADGFTCEPTGRSLR